MATFAETVEGRVFVNTVRSNRYAGRGVEAQSIAVIVIRSNNAWNVIQRKEKWSHYR
jgi:hypothetical protein